MWVGICPTVGCGGILGQPAAVTTGLSVWESRRVFFQPEVFVGRDPGVAVFLLSGLALLPLDGWSGLFQPGNLWRYEHAPELYHQPGQSADLSAGLFSASGDEAFLSLFVRQHLRQSLSVGSSPVV